MAHWHMVHGRSNVVGRECGGVEWGEGVGGWSAVE